MENTSHKYILVFLVIDYITFFCISMIFLQRALACLLVCALCASVGAGMHMRGACVNI
jgi:hypothetical protein